jgi:hypothetical protein
MKLLEMLNSFLNRYIFRLGRLPAELNLGGAATAVHFPIFLIKVFRF